MTHQEYQQMKEKEIEVFEQRLKDMIELEIDACDPAAPGALDTLSDNRKLLADPILLRKAAERFHEVFWDNDEVTQLEHDAADQAMIEIARKAPPVRTGFSITRDGNEIELTKDEIDAFRMSMQRDEINGALSDWLDTLEYNENEEDDAILASMTDRNRDRFLSSFSSSLLTNLLIASDDDDMNCYQYLIDRIFRPVAERIIREYKNDEQG